MEKLTSVTENDVQTSSETNNDDLLGFYLSMFADVELLQTAIWIPFEMMDESVSTR